MQKLLVLGCSSRSNGELTMVLDWVRRVKTPVELHAAVGAGSVKLASWAGAKVHTFPLVGAAMARRKILEILQRVRPDVLVIADIALLHLSTELANGLLPLLPALMQVPKVLALDLYDWDRNAASMDTFGTNIHRAFPPFPSTVGRLLPCPVHIPQRNVPNRFHYPMMDDAGPISASLRRETREKHGLADRPLVVWTTSPWQHPVDGRMLMAPHQNQLAEAQAGERVMLHFPSYALRLLDSVGKRVPGLALLHIGPSPFAVPDGLNSLAYRHVPSLPPEEFRQLLGSADLLFNPNTPASSAIRASTLRVPVISVHQSRAVTTPFSDDDLLQAYLRLVCPTFAWSVWPVGLHTTVRALLAGNPFSNAQAHVDVLAPDALVDTAVRLLTDVAAADAIRHAQDALWRLVSSETDAIDRALGG